MFNVDGTGTEPVKAALRGIGRFSGGFGTGPVATTCTRHRCTAQTTTSFGSTLVVGSGSSAILEIDRRTASLLLVAVPSGAVAAKRMR